MEICATTIEPLTDSAGVATTTQGKLQARGLAYSKGIIIRSFPLYNSLTNRYPLTGTGNQRRFGARGRKTKNSKLASFVNRARQSTTCEAELGEGA
jgi:hypothetical protein